MVTRPSVKKTRTNYFGFGKKKRRRRKRTYFIRGTAVSVLHPYVNKRNRKRKRKRRRKTVSIQKGGFIALIVAALAPTAIDLVKKLIR